MCSWIFFCACVVYLVSCYLFVLMEFSCVVSLCLCSFCVDEVCVVYLFSSNLFSFVHCICVDVACVCVVSVFSCSLCLCNLFVFV